MPDSIVRDQHKRLVVRVVRSPTSDLLLAVSDDLAGLLVPGRSEREIMEKLPAAIRELFEVQGVEVLGITAEPARSAEDRAPSAPAFFVTAHIATR